MSGAGHDLDGANRRMERNASPASFHDPPTNIGPRTYYLDSRRFSPFGFSGVYVLADGGVTLVETGTPLLAPRIIEAVLNLGFREGDIHSAVVTHIHLDHAGAAGWLVRRLPHLRIYVHDRGYRHLADPCRLLRSAETVYGGLNGIRKTHGDILPVPRENLVAVKQGPLRIPGCRQLTVLDAPGHAPHHLCLWDPEAGSVFCGEALGIYLPERDLLHPAAAPPAFDCGAATATIRRIRDLGPEHLFFSQFGPHPDPGRALDDAERQVEYYEVFLRERYLQGRGIEETLKDLARDVFGGKMQLDWAAASTLRSFVLGYYGYFERQR